ncbi:MAG: 30S ribosomal protein S16 [Patescibacteria group bacterium]
MLKIKLARFGKRNQPHYRFVITEARSKRDGKYTESIGQYAPTQTPKILNIDTKAYQEWLAKGAQPTETVASLYKRYESGNPFPEKSARPSKKARAKAAEAETVAAEPAPVTESVKAEEAVSPEAAADKSATEDKK